MLKSLKNTGIAARLEFNEYEAYKKEVEKLDASWKESLNGTLYEHLSVGLSDKYIPAPYNQKNYGNIVYDYRGCFIKTDETVGHVVPYKTMDIGGTVPCAMASVYEHLTFVNEFGKKFKSREELLLHIGNTLVNNGYRTPDAGTLWIAFDKVLELEYDIHTKIQTSMFEAVNSIGSCQPVIALVPASWLHKDPTMPSNEAIVIWAIREDEALITTTSSDNVERVKVHTLFEHVKRAWACKKHEPML